jgi:BCD family chlorophyll transporter-like MFS transporter
VKGFSSNFYKKSYVKWKNVPKSFLPFSDAASNELPLTRLLQLSLFQVSVGIGVVLLVGTLNRIMIVELGVSASIVAVMVALPLLVAPFRAFVGFRSDTYKSVLGWRRVPFIWIGSLLQFGGLSIMPFALILLSGDTHWPLWIGPLSAGFAFLLVGMGVQTTQTAGLALATDLSPEANKPRVVALMYTMLLLGMVVSSLILSFLLESFSQMRLIQVIQGTALVCFFLNLIALWKQEPRNKILTSPKKQHPSFWLCWNKFAKTPNTKRFLLALGVGTAAFSMQDVILEPYGGEILKLSVSETTLLTAYSTVGSIISFGFAAWLLKAKINPHRIAGLGAILGILAFSFIVLSEPISSVFLFTSGVFLIGCGAGFFSVSCLVSAMNLEVDGFTGLALGAWGAVQATAMGIGVALGGILRDGVSTLVSFGWLGVTFAPEAAGYLAVYHLELFLLFFVLILIGPLVQTSKMSNQKSDAKFGLAEFPG